MLLDPTNDEMDVRCEMLLYMASRAQLVVEQISSRLAANPKILAGAARRQEPVRLLTEQGMRYCMHFTRVIQRQVLSFSQNGLPLIWSRIRVAPSLV